MGPEGEKTNFRFESQISSQRGQNSGLRADFRPEGAEFRPEGTDFGPERADFRPERADIRPGWAIRA